MNWATFSPANSGSVGGLGAVTVTSGKVFGSAAELSFGVAPVPANAATKQMI
jgi:hypothetical protein